MIDINVFEPLAISTTQIDVLAPTIYEHEIVADGGYWSARIHIGGGQLNAEEWYEAGLDRRIVALSPDNIPVWEGFVNTVKVRQGRRSRTNGPMLDIANRVRVVYSFVNSSGLDTGLWAATDWADDLVSQGRYGILERVLSAGPATATEAEQYRDTFLAENGQPLRSEEWTRDGANTVELECAGYVRRMKSYIYTNTTTGLQNLSVKVAAVVDADPNGILASTNAQIEANTIQVPVIDTTNRTAWNVIKSLTALGTTSEARCLFGVYGDRLVQYRSVVQATDYLQSQADIGLQVRTPGGAVVAPWYVLPGKWLKAADFMIGHIADTTDQRDNPQFMFIEGVSFKTPDILTLRGGRGDRFMLALAQQGLAGI